MTANLCVTGGSAIMAVDVLKSRGVPEERILFLNLIASPEGIENFATKFPKLRVVTAFVDAGLDEKKYVTSSPDCKYLLTRNKLHHSGSGRLWRQILYHVVTSMRCPKNVGNTHKNKRIVSSKLVISCIPCNAALGLCKQNKSS